MTFAYVKPPPSWIDSTRTSTMHASLERKVGDG